MRDEVKEIIEKLDGLGIRPDNCEHFDVELSEGRGATYKAAYKVYKDTDVNDREVRASRYDKFLAIAKSLQADELAESGLGTISVAEQKGGSDEGSHYHVVLQVGDIFLMTVGWYASHYGTDDFCPFYEVTLQEVKTMEYLKPKKNIDL